MQALVTVCSVLVAFVGGIIVGIQLPLWIQFFVFLAVIAILNSWAVRQLELGAIPYILVGMWLLFGVLVGDIIFVLQVRDLSFDFEQFLKLFKAAPQ